MKSLTESLQANPLHLLSYASCFMVIDQSIAVPINKLLFSFKCNWNLLFLGWGNETYLMQQIILLTFISSIHLLLYFP
jgi:hypothetical protein